MSEYIAERFEHAGLTVKIIADNDADSPKDWDGEEELGIVTTKNRYFSVQQKFNDPDELNPKDPDNKDTLRKYWVFPVYMYAHSGVALSLGRGGQFSDPWDSGQVGFVYAAKSSWRLSKKAFKACEAYIETWNQYLSGDVWGYVIETKGECDCNLDDDEECTEEHDGEHIESCWGFYGIEYARQEAKEQAEYQAKSAKQAEAIMHT